jgi:hypothetical protein
MAVCGRKPGDPGSFMLERGRFRGRGRRRFHRLRSRTGYLLLSVPNPCNLTFRPENILVGSPPALIFSLEHGMKLLQVRQRRFFVIGPGLVLGTLGLETPASTRFDYPDFSLGPIFVPLYPGMAVMHSL